MKGLPPTPPGATLGDIGTFGWSLHAGDLPTPVAVVAASGGDKSHIVKMTVYVSDIELWERVNDVYAEFFGLYRPARAMVPVKELHHGFQIEIEAVAALP